ncbi:MAG: TraR/DksA C4-type zinc finger protein [Actinomycetota bacterium]|nr:TraR/DksA C4-type zinc finger protein [Actinomycetota bacterium]
MHLDVDRILAEREERLESELAELTSSVADAGSISFGKRVGEGTSMAVERLAAVSTHEQLLSMLQDVRRARHRLAEGGYGLCELCGGPIPQERLEALPWAVRCAQHPAGHGPRVGIAR